MYIGGTDERALHHCVSEVLDNSVDEHLAGHCKKIDVTIHVDGSISIRDDGRGIPVDIHPQYKIPGVEMVLTTCTRAASMVRAATNSPAARTASAPSASTPSANG
jgi:DNA gyrase/topoisomerase IV subunit B